MLILFWRIVIASAGHGKNLLQKRMMTIQVAVIASGAKQSRVPDNVRVNDFVIISAGHGRNPLQKRVMTSQVAVIARHEAIQIESLVSGLLRRSFRQAQCTASSQ